ncbi:hypothetical protein BJY52DRAFT_407952 [Lactarius psammicola]|nr:hypothetical protein BJY52DRAFT_407952 [Lactarius psammicola]
MSLSVSSFPEAHSRLTTNPTWGEGSSPTTKRRFFGGRLNTGGASLMKGIRHIGVKVQLKSSVARRAPKPSPQNLRPTPPPRLSVRASTIIIDIISVPHNNGRQSSTDISRAVSIPSPIPWPRWRAVPLLVRNPRQRAISAGARGAASGTVQQPRTRVDSEAARAACGGSTSPSPPWQLETNEMGPVPDLPVVILTPADASDPDGSPSGVTHEPLSGDSNLRRRETRTTVLRRSLSSLSLAGKHVSNKSKELPPKAAPSPLPLLSMHIAPLRSGSRPAPTPLSPLLAAVGPRPKTAPTTRVTKPVAPTVLPMPPRRLMGPRSTRDGHGSASSGGSPFDLSRSRSQPQLRTAAILNCATRSAAASAAVEQPILSRSRAGPPSPALALAEGTPGQIHPFSGSANPTTPTGRSALSVAAATGTPKVLQEAPRVRAFPQGREVARGERRPRTAPETGSAARPLAPAAWELHEMGAAGSRQRTRPRLPYGPR